MGGGLDILFLGTSLGEETDHSLHALLGELLVATGGTGLLVSVTVDGELGVTIDHILGEVLEVSLFTGGDSGGTAVEVHGDRGTGLDVNSGELTVLNRVVTVEVK